MSSEIIFSNKLTEENLSWLIPSILLVILLPIMFAENYLFQLLGATNIAKIFSLGSILGGIISVMIIDLFAITISPTLNRKQVISRKHRIFMFFILALLIYHIGGIFYIFNILNLYIFEVYQYNGIFWTLEFYITSIVVNQNISSTYIRIKDLKGDISISKTEQYLLFIGFRNYETEFKYSNRKNIKYSVMKFVEVEINNTKGRISCFLSTDEFQSLGREETVKLGIVDNWVEERGIDLQNYAHDSEFVVGIQTCKVSEAVELMKEINLTQSYTIICPIPQVKLTIDNQVKWLSRDILEKLKSDSEDIKIVDL